MQFYSIFGNENAESDDNLMDCEVIDIPFRNEQKPILTGRWGTGKTASLLLDNQKLSTALRKVSNEYERIWYIDEKSLNIDALFAIQKKFGNDQYSFTKGLEQIWKAEIIRRACLVLSTLHSVYNINHSSSWDFMIKIRKKKSFLTSVWDQIPNAIDLIKPGVDQMALSDIQKQLRMLFTNDAMNHMQKCLMDIQGHDLYPVIAVEPIETPTSSIEKHVSMAQALITSLLNSYYNWFEPKQRQLLFVRLTIPWHRYKTEKVDFPQKLRQYRCYVSWRKKSLRKFINRRIEWEFKRNGRSFKTKGDKDAWDTLFEKSIINKNCNPTVMEGSFDFAIRHTHHRPRDIQRIARKSVELFSKYSNKDITSIFRGVGGIKIPGARLKQAITNLSKENANELITEAGRRYKFVRQMVNCMKGMKIPFNSDTLADRITFSKSTWSLNPREIVSQLWSAGIIGFEITPKTQKPDLWDGHFSKSTLRRIKNIEGEEFVGWFLFQYSWKADAYGTFEKYKNDPDFSIKFIIHPMFSYYIVPSHNNIKYPIGI